MTLSPFRKMIRAIGEHDRPSETAYRYEVIEFWPNGTFRRISDLQITKTQMRMMSKDRQFEEQVAGEWKLIDSDMFQAYRIAWDTRRATLGYSLVEVM